jgi:hypothetical protein
VAVLFEVLAGTARARGMAAHANRKENMVVRERVVEVDDNGMRYTEPDLPFIHEQLHQYLALSRPHDVMMPVRKHDQQG